MTPFEAIILGVVQGITEFLPISSSGHLIIARSMLHLPLENTLTFDTILQLATVIALVIYFWKDILNILLSVFRTIRGQYSDKKEKILAWSVVFGTIPAVFFGLLLESYMETIFRDIVLVSIALLLGSILMYVAEFVGKQNKELTVRNGFIVGLFQSLALIPGVSRSGATISGGLFMGLTRDEAVRFSFILSIPILLGSGIKKLLEVDFVNSPFDLNLLLGSVTSFVLGFLVIHYFIKYMKRHTLNVFIIYRIVLAIFLLFLF